MTTQSSDAGPRRELRWFDLLDKGEFFGALFIVVSWSVLLLAEAPLATIALLMGIGVALLIVALINGSNFSLTLLVMYVSLIGWLGAASIGGQPLAYAAVGVSVLAIVDLVRISHARRRASMVSATLLPSAMSGIMVLTVISAVSAYLAGVVTGLGRGGFWLIPATIVAVLVLVAVLVEGSNRAANEVDSRKWTPGERLPPPPTRR